jgi:uncharacterized membrane protein YeiB
MVIINFNEALAPSYNGPAWLRLITEGITGRAAVTFVVLAGVGMSLMARKARLSGDPVQRHRVRLMLMRRAAILFVTGMLFVTLWEGDILHFYGVFILAGSLMLFWPSRLLWGAVALLNVGFIGMLLALSYGAGWNWEDLSFTDFWTPRGYLRNLVFNGWFPIFPWFGFMLVGIWMGRLDLRNRTVLTRCFLWGAGIALLAETASLISMHYVQSRWPDLRWELTEGLFGRGCLPPGPLFVLSTAGGSVSVIALCIYLADTYRDAAWLAPLIITGRYAFSLYLAHVLLVIHPLLLLGWDDVTLAQSVSAALVTCVVALSMCTLWQRRFARGPLEWILRRLAGG